MENTIPRQWWLYWSRLRNRAVFRLNYFLPSWAEPVSPLTSTVLHLSESPALRRSPKYFLAGESEGIRRALSKSSNSSLEVV